jgi:hypothetical protein
MYCSFPGSLAAPPEKWSLAVPVHNGSHRVIDGVKLRCNAFARVSINACRLVFMHQCATCDS